MSTHRGGYRRPESRAASAAAMCPAPSALRMDMHCHSRASSGPATALLGRIGCPECYSEPEAVYDQAIARGMDLVTITDHDAIDGVMELVERGFPNVVVGEEVTVYFPEDRCKLHVLVWGLTPEQHAQLAALRLRDDVYRFAAWLFEQNLAHALAHPLYVQNGKLARWHVERCALLFKCFETLNGAHAGQHRSVLERFLAGLTPAAVLKLVDAHGLHPIWPRIWEKGRTGGSDDHGLLNIGQTFTEVRPDPSPVGPIRAHEEPARTFLRGVMAARSEVGGVAGHSSLLAHQLAAVGGQFFARTAAKGLRPRQRLVASRLLAFTGATIDPPGTLGLVADSLRSRLAGRRRQRPALSALREVIGPILASYPDLACRLDPVAWSLGSPVSQHERMAKFADELAAGLARSLAGGALRSIAARDRRRILDHGIAYAGLLAAQAPYLFSLFHQNKERHLLQSMNPGADSERPMRVCLFTDTLGDVNGVSRFIRDVAEQAETAGRDLRVITSTRFEIPKRSNLINFDPIFAVRMPKYENLELVLPPLLPMLRYIDRHQPDVIHISTPGPVGCVGMAAARMLRVPVAGTYHTDFPAYIERLFDDPFLTSGATGFMRMFYKPFRTIFSRSTDYAAALERLGIAPDRIIRLRPGINTGTFNAAHRDEQVWQHVGVPRTGAKVLYCGRVSVEKNLPLLCTVWKQVRARLGAGEAQLVIIGDGPYRAEMQRELGEEGVHFLGFRHGQELSTLYASADLFVFPSITDTLGQVVMEAQSSGLPVLVSDQGGPKEVVLPGRTGLVLESTRPAAWAEAIATLVRDGDLRRRMGAAAAEYIRPMTIRASFEHWWQTHELTVREAAKQADPDPQAHIAARGFTGTRSRTAAGSR